MCSNPQLPMWTGELTSAKTRTILGANNHAATANDPKIAASYRLIIHLSSFRDTVLRIHKKIESLSRR
jgi:hypothetical protein